eukprot:2074127-Prorocentrum_lima.AAC.1
MSLVYLAHENLRDRRNTMFKADEAVVIAEMDVKWPYQRVKEAEEDLSAAQTPSDKTQCKELLVSMRKELGEAQVVLCKALKAQADADKMLKQAQQLFSGLGGVEG